MILAEWLVGGLSVISADQIPYTQFGEDLKFQKKIYCALVKLMHVCEYVPRNRLQKEIKNSYPKERLGRIYSAFLCKSNFHEVLIDLP